MGFKARASGTTANDEATRQLRAEVAGLKRALDTERQQTQELEIELSECTDKYQELTRKSMDFEEHLGDVEQDRDDALAMVDSLQGRREVVDEPAETAAPDSPEPSIASRLPLPAPAQDDEETAVDVEPSGNAS